MITIGTTFSGIGAPEQSLKNLGVEHQVKWACDIDADAKKTYLDNHGCEKWYDDILDINPAELELVDIYIFGFPCFPKGELVLTDKGFEEIQNLKVGDRVLTHTNQYKNISKIFPVHIEQLYEINAVGLFPIKVTKDHPFLIKTKIESGWTEPQFVRLSEIKEKSYVGFSINQESKLPEYSGYNIPLRGLQKTLQLDSPYFWKMVGLYIADGWTTNYKRCGRKNSWYKKVMICCNHKSKSKTINLINDAGFKATISEEGSIFKFTISNSELYNFLQRFGRYAHGKYLTNDILDLPVDLAKAFLEGYLMGDGSENEQSIRFCSVSKKLALGIQHLFHKIYHRVCKLYYNEVGPQAVIEERLINQRNSYHGVFMKNPVRQMGHFDKGIIWQPIRSIKNLSIEEEVYNFEVEEDNSYTVNNCIVHNCTDISTEGEMDLSKGRSSLAHTSLDIIEAILPKVIIFENVAALLFSKFKEFYENIVERIKENYDFCAYKVNSKDFGVPQSRPRVYGVGIRKDLGFSASGFRFNMSKSHISDILEEKVDEKYFISQERVAKILETCRTKQKDFVYLPDKLGEVKHVRSNGFQPDKKIRYSGNSFCLTCSVHHGIVEGGRIRKFTPRECARLQGFPDSFKIPSADSTAFAQFGNSMTVPVIQQILLNILWKL